MRARITGVVYLLYFVTAIAAQSLVSRGHATAGFVLNLVAAGVYIALTVLLYYLFRPVNPTVSLVAAALSLAGCAITVLNLYHLATASSPLVFFGPYCVLLGYLTIRSTFLPRALGVLLVIAGVGWLIFVGLPPTSVLVRPIEGLGVLAEGLLMLWLLIFGEKRPVEHAGG